MAHGTIRTAHVSAWLAVLTFCATGALAADASLCVPGERVWFNASVVDSDQLVSVCGAEPADDAVRWLQFRMGVPGKIALAGPKRRADSTKAFTYRRYTRYRVTYLKLALRIDGHDYALLESDVSEVSPTYSLRLRVRKAADGTDLATHALKPISAPLAMMRLENLVRSLPWDE